MTLARCTIPLVAALLVLPAQLYAQGSVPNQSNTKDLLGRKIIQQEKIQQKREEFREERAKERDAAVHAHDLTPERLAEIVAASDRSAEDREIDKRRQPAKILGFIGMRPGMSALDISAFHGYTTELLARAIGPTGHVYAQAFPTPPKTPDADNSQNAKKGPSARMTARVDGVTQKAIDERNAAMKQANVAAAPMTTVRRRLETPAPEAREFASLDLVTLMFNYHDFGYLEVDRAAMNHAVFRALKLGGMYVIADHAGRDGTGISEANTLHRIEKAFLIKEVEAAGFKLVAEGDFLRNPDDKRDNNVNVAPFPKDEFILKFERIGPAGEAPKSMPK